MRPTPKDLDLYNAIKGDLFAKHKPSAYRSGLLVKTYKRKYLELYGDGDAYFGERSPTMGLTRWFIEDWRNQRGEVGYKYASDIYRPTRRVSPQTPKTLRELGAKDVDRAMREKALAGRVKRF